MVWSSLNIQSTNLAHIFSPPEKAVIGQALWEHVIFKDRITEWWENAILGEIRNQQRNDQISNDKRRALFLAGGGGEGSEYLFSTTPTRVVESLDFVHFQFSPCFSDIPHLLPQMFHDWNHWILFSCHNAVVPLPCWNFSPPAHFSSCKRQCHHLIWGHINLNKCAQ